MSSREGNRHLVTRARQDRVIALLARRGDWLTAAHLADALGVTPRSIRSYVTAINARVPAGDAVESGPLGYRIDRAHLAALRDSSPETGTPRDRLHTLVRALIDAEDGLDVHESAGRFYVSDATFEGDLARVRALIAPTGLTLERSAARVRLRGPEGEQRRLLSRLVHDEMDAGALDMPLLRRSLGAEYVDPDTLAAFKSDLVAALAPRGFYVNEYAITDVLLHVAIAVDRTRRRRVIEDADPVEGATAEVAATVAELISRHFSVEPAPAEARHLATLLLTRVVAPAEDHGEDARQRLDPEVESAVRDAVQRAAAEFAVDLDHDDFVLRLALHVQNLRHRARTGAWSRNPLTRSIKSSYPMIFEIAVFLSVQLHERLELELHDDELAYIAMHVGGRLERSRRADAIVTATIVCPGYYELHELLRSSVDRSLSQAIEVVTVDTRADPDWSAIDSDLVLTTIAPPTASDRVVRVQPFLTEADVERVQAAAARVRRARRLARLRAELEQYFDASAFVRGLDAAAGEDDVIRQLGTLLVARGVIDEDYIERTIERERLSSTAFTDALAVPHALTMTATRTAIAVAVGEQSMPWGDARVQVVALVAFSENDREAFQTIFEQLVEVFSERESVQRIVRRGVDFAGFLDELVAVIDG
ncbi:PTS sugar transporter subunit IIA [Microbacterium sp. LRZ72]|uniref:BglG family transcription antiterminator n=1 Tax=Microbacterium sp. LRZ72 TaxID=2942481 RepID=UPI0029B2A8BB|nr:PTS sugar transporter subunit IIA [Microbacterium sp. LRZ72]MDX2376988.1 PTS sugar transporter subunit IIA [Microbacterium sp. LRZ72]